MWLGRRARAPELLFGGLHRRFLDNRPVDTVRTDLFVYYVEELPATISPRSSAPDRGVGQGAPDSRSPTPHTHGTARRLWGGASWLHRVAAGGRVLESLVIGGNVRLIQARELLCQALDGPERLVLLHGAPMHHDLQRRAVNVAVRHLRCCVRPRSRPSCPVVPRSQRQSGGKTAPRGRGKTELGVLVLVLGQIWRSRSERGARPSDRTMGQ